MNNVDNKQTNITDMSGKLDHMLEKIQDINSQLRNRITKPEHEMAPEIMNILMAIGLSLEMIMRVVMLIIGVLLRKRKKYISLD